jgi:hypothetical protein
MFQEIAALHRSYLGKRNIELVEMAVEMGFWYSGHGIHCHWGE